MSWLHLEADMLHAGRSRHHLKILQPHLSVAHQSLAHQYPLLQDLVHLQYRQIQKTTALRARTSRYSRLNPLLGKSVTVSVVENVARTTETRLLGHGAYHLVNMIRMVLYVHCVCPRGGEPF